jgi:hypothetical protein
VQQVGQLSDTPKPSFREGLVQELIFMPVVEKAFGYLIADNPAPVSKCMFRNQ